MLGIVVLQRRLRQNSQLVPIILWTLVAALFMEVLVAIPGTHIYVYLIPLMMLLGWGGTYFWRLLKILGGKKVDYLAVFGLSVVTAFLCAQAYAVFVDHKVEYPWQDKKFLLWIFPKPTPIFHLSIFGFPYYRHWQEVGNFVNSGTSIYYTTNERVSIARYHVNLEKAGEKIGYYVYIYSPQTFTDDILNVRGLEWSKTNAPLKSFYGNYGQKHVDIYLVPENFVPKTVETVNLVEEQLND
jgi:hypothetical protein